MDIERNDVDLTKLFKWNREVEITDEKGNIVTSIYMRVVGDAELNQARVFALRESSNLRRALKTKGTPEREAFVSDLEVREPEFIAKATLLLSMNELATEARRRVVINFPKEPGSEAPLAEQEKYQEVIDNFPLEYGKLVGEEIVKLQKKKESELLALPLEKLQKEYEESLIKSLCSAKMSGKFRDKCIFLGTFKNKELKERVFKTFEEYDNSATEIKEQLLFAYEELEFPVENLKKSPEATQ